MQMWFEHHINLGSWLVRMSIRKIRIFSTETSKVLLCTRVRESLPDNRLIYLRLKGSRGDLQKFKRKAKRIVS